MLLTNSDNSIQINYTPTQKKPIKTEDEIIQFLLEAFEDNPEKFTPVIIAQSETKTFFVDFSHSGETEKQNILYAVSLLLKTFDCTSYMIVVECWLKSFKTDNDELEKFKKTNKRISTYDDKDEKLILTKCYKDNNQEMRIFDIIRNGNKAKLKEDITTKKFKGSLSDIFNFICEKEYKEFEDKDVLKEILLNHPRIDVWDH